MMLLCIKHCELGVNHHKEVGRNQNGSTVVWHCGLNTSPPLPTLRIISTMSHNSSFNSNFELLSQLLVTKFKIWSVCHGVYLHLHTMAFEIFKNLLIQLKQFSFSFWNDTIDFTAISLSCWKSKFRNISTDGIVPFRSVNSQHILADNPRSCDLEKQTHCYPAVKKTKSIIYQGTMQCVKRKTNS